MRVVLSIMLFFLLGSIKSQTGDFTIKSNPEIYIYTVDTIYGTGDSLIEFKKEEDGFTKNWDIYFASDKKQLAFSCRVYNDTVIQKHFWRNGKLKQVCVRKSQKDNNGFHTIYTLKSYCNNGTLLEALDINTAWERTHISYYCNGKRKKELLRDSIYNPVKATEWYDNGQKKTEYFYYDGGRDGISYIRDRNGNVVKKDVWKNGKHVILIDLTKARKAISINEIKLKLPMNWKLLGGYKERSDTFMIKIGKDTLYCYQSKLRDCSFLICPPIMEYMDESQPFEIKDSALLKRRGYSNYKKAIEDDKKRYGAAIKYNKEAYEYNEKAVLENPACFNSNFSEEYFAII